MNLSIDESSSAGLSVQPQAITCPKCQHKRAADDQGPAWQCPNCGVAYNKAMASADAVAHKVDRTPSARGRPEIARDEWETFTPGVLSFSLQGRIGRLRYLAFSWPIMLLSGLGMAAAVAGPLHKQSPNIGLLIIVGVMWFWLSLRSMALRLHDVDRSAKWLLALLLLPGGFAALGGGQQMVAICGGLFWVIALLLVLLPGTEGDNDYGPPPGANTGLVKVGAALFLALMAVGVVANIKYMQYIRSGKLNSALATAPGLAPAPSLGRELPGSGTARLAKSDFVGTWQGRNMSLRVDNFGNTLFFHLDGNSSIRADGPLRVLDGNHISVGMGPNPFFLNVMVPPHVEGEVTRMTLDGVELTRNN